MADSIRVTFMDKKVKQALARDRVIDITTTGRRTGRPRRIEIWFHNLDGHLYITGLPGRRSWYANLQANPEFIFHLKENLNAHLPARARPIDGFAERRQVIAGILQNLGRSEDLDAWVDGSPLVEVELLN
jgi:deazaflavin-dependent oxidoreductase (nitroreductase family)